MLIFGDSARIVCPDEALATFLEHGAAFGAATAGILAHEAIASAFVDAAELAQGIVDASFEAEGVDTASRQADAAMHLVMVLARNLNRSWMSGFAHQADDVCRAIQVLLASKLPPRVRCKRAEGYAFYALYPESYLESALRLPAKRGGQIIGIRSIGLGLAAIVASATGAALPISVRPVGHPFQRRLSLSDDLAARLSRATGDIAIVDEGPGLSGSSFGAVLDHLETQGTAASRIHLFPSHAGDPGHQASPRQRTRWRRLQRHVTGFEPLLLDNPDPRRRLESWFTDLTGAPKAPLLDLSGGAWRQHHYPSEADWRAANISQERRKYLLKSDSGPWLLKFAGLGRYGRDKLRWAAALEAGGFIPPVAGLRHGFLAERWMEDWTPLQPQEVGRDRLVRQLGEYLGFRARHFAVDAEFGSSTYELATMARFNAGKALSGAADRQLGDVCAKAEDLEARVRRIATDNRLQAWEWLQHPDGRLLKTDALDHSASHDLVGCQDVAWDIAGATAEFDLTEAEKNALVSRIEAVSGHAVDADLLRFLSFCYLAFQFGAAEMARESLSDVPVEAARLEREAARYRARLVLELDRGSR